MARVRDHSIEDILSSRYAADANLSKDGARVAFTISGVYKSFREEMTTEVAVLSIDDKKQRIFSQQGWSNYSPRLSPTGDRLAYLSRKGEEFRLLVHNLRSDSGQDIVVEGEPAVLEWHGEESLIVLIKDVDPRREEKKKGDDGYFFEEDPRYDSLWRYNFDSGFQRITKGIQVWEFDVNGDKIAAITSELPYEWSWYDAAASLIDLNDGKIRKVYSRRSRQVAKPRLSPDNRRLIILESLWSDRGVNSGDVVSIDLRGLTSKNITEGEEESYSEVRWKSNEEFYALSNGEGTFSVSIISEGGRRILWSKYGSVYRPWSPSFSISGSRLLLSFESARQADELIMFDLNTRREKTITSINKNLRGCRSYSSEKVSWKSTDGLEIWGIYRSAGKNSPLMVMVHGGPTGVSVDSFVGISTLFLSRGYSVFLPNYRGSVGRGREYAELNLGDMGGMDLQDILSGVDYIVKNRGVDRKRIYITGGSYGGFMSAWAITQTDIFKGSISLFGISDWISFHGVSNLPAWDKIHYDQDPYKFDKFLKFSPLWHVDKVNTPILLAHGIEDPYVPVGQYYQLYRALKERGKDVRLLLFPREGHGFRERKHIEQFYTEIFEWLKERR